MSERQCLTLLLLQDGQEPLPKVKLRSGLRDKRAGSLKVRLKASEADKATGSRMPGSTRGKTEKVISKQSRQQQPPRLSVKLGGSQLQSPSKAAAAAAQQTDTGQRNSSLRVKLRVSSLEKSIPQLDGAADTEDDEVAISPQHHNAHMETHAGSKPADGLEQPLESCGRVEVPQQPVPSSAPLREELTAQAADLGERLSTEPALHAGDLAKAEEPKPGAPESATAVSHPEQSSIPLAKNNDSAASEPRLSNGHVPQQTESGLTNVELAALPVLVSALREWLDAQAGRIPGIGDQEIAQV